MEFIVNEDQWQKLWVSSNLLTFFENKGMKRSNTRSNGHMKKNILSRGPKIAEGHQTKEYVHFNVVIIIQDVFHHSRNNRWFFLVPWPQTMYSFFPGHPVYISRVSSKKKFNFDDSNSRSLSMFIAFFINLLALCSKIFSSFFGWGSQYWNTRVRTWRVKWHFCRKWNVNQCEPKICYVFNF